MKTAYLERRAINQLNRDTIYETDRYRYFMEEDSVCCLRREYLDTTVALSHKSDSNPKGWEYVKIRVKGGQEE